jgi:3-methyladenine DNA glycosylase AlkD
MQQTPTIAEIQAELATLATPRMKKYYLSLGVNEPVYGAPTGAMKPLARRIKGNQALAEALYASGNFDSMYLAGMIADVPAMTQADFRRWMAAASCPTIADFIVSVSLAEADFAQELAREFIDSTEETTSAGGWNCYEWLLGSRPDHEFAVETVQVLLERVQTTYDQQSPVVQSAMQRVVVAIAVSYRPLHGEALALARHMMPQAVTQIEQAIAKGRIGFKRRHVRC